MKSSMVRFVAAYRWELLLFLVAPAVARLANRSDLCPCPDSYFDSGWLEVIALATSDMGLSGTWSLRLYWASAMHECAAWDESS